MSCPSPLRRTASTPPPTNLSQTFQKSPKLSKSNTFSPFKFCLYFTLTITLITVFSQSIFSSQDAKSWFLSLPLVLHSHYSNGRSLKIESFHYSPSKTQSLLNGNLKTRFLELFTVQNGVKRKRDTQNVLIVHGLGFSSYGFRNLVEDLGKKGVFAVAIDLPGSGFSDKSVKVEEEGFGGFFGGLREVYYEISEKGLFSKFDQLVEKGYIDREEVVEKKIIREVIKSVELGSEEMGSVLRQVVETLGLKEVDLVLHDSALGLSANWILENREMVRSVTILDAFSSVSAFPLWVLEVPIVREVVLKFDFVFKKVVESCCSRFISGTDLEAHRVLLKGRDGRKAVVGMGRNRNCSFDLKEWGSLVEAKGLPLQVVWGNGWSKEWKEEGEKVASLLPKASFVTHSGGRWPQDDAMDELAESISQFLSKLPEPDRQIVEEPIPKYVQKRFDEAKDDDNHQYSHVGQSQDHVRAAGYMDDAYGLGNAWAS